MLPMHGSDSSLAAGRGKALSRAGGPQAGGVSFWAAPPGSADTAWADHMPATSGKRSTAYPLVPAVGLEPTWPQGPRDFKSLASANSATPARRPTPCWQGACSSASPQRSGKPHQERLSRGCIAGRRQDGERPDSRQQARLSIASTNCIDGFDVIFSLTHRGLHGRITFRRGAAVSAKSDHSDPLNA